MCATGRELIALIRALGEGAVHMDDHSHDGVSHEFWPPLVGRLLAQHLAGLGALLDLMAETSTPLSADKSLEILMALASLAVVVDCSAPQQESESAVKLCPVEILKSAAKESGLLEAWLHVLETGLLVSAKVRVIDGCAKRPEMTARKLAPASTSSAPFSGVMPPIATMGMSSAARAARRVSSEQGLACGLVPEEKKLPNAT
jgi:hypothetical protein